MRPFVSGVLLCVVAACGGSTDVSTGVTTGTTTGTTTGSGSVVVTTAVAMLGSAFVPPNIQVSPGAVVTWSNGDAFAHNVTFTSGVTSATGNFVSGSKQLTMPTTAGTYSYRCTLHAGMEGSVVVK